MRLPEGLYAITPEIADTRRLVELVAAAIEGGAAAVQLRNKSARRDRLHEQGEALLHLCRRGGVPLIINDDVELAVALDAHGVHLGADDGDIAAARARLGPQRLLGASCYNRFELARAAQAAGASYVAFGAVFPSPTKPHAVRAEPELFGRAKAELAVPAVAIGGITADNAAPIVAAGAHALAVISDLFDAPDVAARARRFRNLYERMA